MQGQGHGLVGEMLGIQLPGPQFRFPSTYVKSEKQ